MCRKCAPQNITRTPARNEASTRRPRTLIQANVNAPIANTWSAVVQLTAFESGKIRNSQFGG